MAKTVTQKLYQVECAPACGFLVRNHNETELVPIVITHCLNTHNQVQTVDQVRGMIRAA
jgi:predicted small metal-binding protein